LPFGNGTSRILHNKTSKGIMPFCLAASIPWAANSWRSIVALFRLPDFRPAPKRVPPCVAILDIPLIVFHRNGMSKAT
jgi:hypothetical protein